MGSREVSGQGPHQGRVPGQDHEPQQKETADIHWAPRCVSEQQCACQWARGRVRVLLGVVGVGGRKCVMVCDGLILMERGLPLCVLSFGF